MRMSTLIGLLALAVAAPVAGQAPDVSAHDRHVVIQGCVAEAGARDVRPRSLLVWTRDNVVLTRAQAVSGFPVVEPGDDPEPFVYWLEDDTDLARFVGQYVEVDGELTDIAEADVRLRPVTEITLDLGGERGVAYVPSAWLQPAGTPAAVTYDTQVRRIDVERVQVLRACEAA